MLLQILYQLARCLLGLIAVLVRRDLSKDAERPCCVNVTGAFATIGQRLIDHGAIDGTINDFGLVHSIFFRDLDGLEGAVLIGKD